MQTMKAKKSSQKTKKSSETGKRFPLPKGGGYIEKMPDGFYKAFREDGTEITGVNIPINIALMALRGKLPGAVSYYPSDDEVAMEPALKALQDKFK